MASNEPDKSEKTEPASPFKLDDARKKGTVAKSTEVNTMMALFAGLIFLIAAGATFIDKTLQLSAKMFSSAGQVNFELRQFLDTTSHWVADGMSILAPLLAIVIIVGVLSTFVQIGPIFSFTPIKPDFKRLNPIAGFKRLFSIKLLFESGKSILKLMLFALVIYLTLTGLIDHMLGLYTRSHSQITNIFTGFAAELIFRLLCVVALIAVIDFLFTRWEFARNLRMTRKEVKDEAKRREGDPAVRQKRRELERELRKRGESVSNVPKADLVITNPTRYAILLKYDRYSMVAPVVTGKGTGETARLIREAAYRHKIPVISAPSLTRELFRRCDIYGSVEHKYFAIVARLFRQAYAIKAAQVKAA
ncbi:EscU/YscU/HrcU family type III secretion system export apparatus switch protein [Flavobacteriaceae bacterium]|nr:EscU/YscU/HrcU family type III secretion system export apparatus switch protein [Flavobacteriaceae bacterium]